MDVRLGSSGRDAPFDFQRTFGEFYDFGSPDLRLYDDFDEEQRVATINGTPTPDPDKSAAVREWMAAALRRETT
ncbi:MAG: hypothetical protein ABIQ18_36705 [Umezawaea sp.]